MHDQPEAVSDSNSRNTVRLALQLLLVAALLLFVALALAQSVVRFVSPSLFAWGSGFLPAGHGAANTVALILSCAPMAAAHRITAKTNRWTMIAALSATFIGGIAFLAVQSVEYENTLRQGLGWGSAPSSTAGVTDGAPVELVAGNVGAGRERWLTTCRACHGDGGEGVEGQGKDLRRSAFVQNLDDGGLLAFIKEGRLVSAPLNTTGKPMPPKGGNPLLKDPQIMDIVAYIRSIQVSIDGGSDEKSEDADAEADIAISPIDGDPDEAGAADKAEQIDAGGEFWIPRSSVPLAALGPTGLAPQAFEPATRPARANIFFGFFFLMTGVHALLVVIGLAIIIWLIFRAVQMPYCPSRDVPVGLASVFWYFAVGVWVVLFPMFYFA